MLSIFFPLILSRQMAGRLALALACPTSTQLQIQLQPRRVKIHAFDPSGGSCSIDFVLAFPFRDPFWQF
jgi:hypothetical protein